MDSSVKVDSRNDYSASAESMDCHAANASRNDDKNADSSVDCHADFQSARNNRKKAAFSKVDSSSTATHSHCELCESKARQSTNQKWILGETPEMQASLQRILGLTKRRNSTKPQFYKSRRRQDFAKTQQF